MDKQKNETNMMAILGFIFSFIFSLVGLILSIIALRQIKETHEEGRGLATAGLIISIIKMVFTVFIIIIMCIAIILSGTSWNSLQGDIIDHTKCSFAKECKYDETSGNYNCIYEENGGEEYIICDEESITDFKDKSTYYSDHKDDEDYIDTFDYDREY